MRADICLGCSCFERFFKAVNSKDGRIIARRRSGYMMDDLDLIGLDYLWRVSDLDLIGLDYLWRVCDLDFSELDYLWRVSDLDLIGLDHLWRVSGLDLRVGLPLVGK